MGRAMKYIVYMTDTGPISAIMFPSHVEHRTMANLLELTSEDIYGAGFVHFDDANGLYCDGFSTSLGRGARPEDTTLIRNLLK